MSVVAKPVKPRRESITDRLIKETMGCKLHRCCWGVRRKLQANLLGEMAQGIDCDASWLGVSKRLIDTRHPAWRAVRKPLNQAVEYWMAYTVPHPDPGIRLIRADRNEEFIGVIHGLQETLTERVSALCEVWDELKSEARTRLGRAFDEDNYVLSTYDFQIQVSNPSLLPDDRLKKLTPEIYEAQMGEFQEVMETALRQQKEEFAKQLYGMVSELRKRLEQDSTGQRKVLRSNALDSFRGFFARFRELNFNEGGIVEIVQQAEDIISGVTPSGINADPQTANLVEGELARITNSLDDHLVRRTRFVTGRRD